MYCRLGYPELIRRAADGGPVFYDVLGQLYGPLFHVAFHICTTPMLKPAWKKVCCKTRRYA